MPKINKYDLVEIKIALEAYRKWLLKETEKPMEEARYMDLESEQVRMKELAGLIDEWLK